MPILRPKRIVIISHLNTKSCNYPEMVFFLIPWLSSPHTNEYIYIAVLIVLWNKWHGYSLIPFQQLFLHYAMNPRETPVTKGKPIIE